MNVHDSERMVRLMERCGWEVAPDPAVADLVVVNTCSVREKAYRKVRSAVGALKPLRRRSGGGPVIAVAGCVARQEGERWLELCPHIDIVMGPDAVGRLPGHVDAVLAGGPPVVDVAFDDGRPADFLRPVLPGGVEGPTAYVTVMKGCSHRCTFCIVPSVRGPMRHRPSDEVVSEVRALVAGGVREVTLLGQTVNAWREPGASGTRRDFAWLLGRLDAVAGLERIRYTSPHPLYVPPALVRAHAELPALCEHVHLPAQSGSDRVLERMGRRHDRERYLEIVGDLRAAREGFALSTDLIVGFPGETDDDFRRTLELVQRVRFDTFFSFMYSERPGTRAARWEDDVPPSVKHERLKALHALGERLTAEQLSRDLHREVEVLVQGRSKSGGGQLTGRTRTNRIVNFTPGSRAVEPGELARVRVTDVMPHCLLGEPC
jgi:tRNA-2-methylthio-N6-dimethylallyladenosine synthase